MTLRCRGSVRNCRSFRAARGAVPVFLTSSFSVLYCGRWVQAGILTILTRIADTWSRELR